MLRSCSPEDFRLIEILWMGLVGYTLLALALSIYNSNSDLWITFSYCKLSGDAEIPVNSVTLSIRGPLQPRFTSIGLGGGLRNSTFNTAAEWREYKVLVSWQRSFSSKESNPCFNLHSISHDEGYHCHPPSPHCGVRVLPSRHLTAAPFC